MKKVQALILAALCAACAIAADGVIRRLVWQVETSDPVERNWSLVYGESVDFEVRYLDHRAPMNLAGATVVLHAVTNGMPSGYSFQATGEVYSAAGTGWARVRTAVNDLLPPAASNVSYRIVATLSGSTNLMVAAGALRVSGSGTGTPAAVPVPLWLSLSNQVAQLQTVNAAPRLTLLEANTNDWNAAYGWGNHALANYMAATSRTERLYAPGSSNEWRDGDGRVWRIVTTQSTDRVITFGPGFQTSGGVVPPQSSYPFPGSDGLWDWGQEGDALSIQYMGAQQSFWTSSNFPSYPAILPPVQNAAGTATVSYVWVTTTQQVDTVALASQLPGIVYSNSVSALTIYTNASGAATSWWQVASGVTNSGTFASGTPGAITNGSYYAKLGGVTITNDYFLMGVSTPQYTDGFGGVQDNHFIIRPPSGFNSGILLASDTPYIQYADRNLNALGDFGFYGEDIYFVNRKNGKLRFGHQGKENELLINEEGGVLMANSLTVSKTNTAAVVRSQSSYLLPHLGTNTTISLIFTNGTLQAWESEQ